MEQKKNYDSKGISSRQKEEIGFDLDAYIAEQSQPLEKDTESDNLSERSKYRIKNVLLLVGLILISAWWYNDWQLPIFNSSSNDGTATAPAVTQGFSYQFNVPEVVIPPIPPIPDIDIPAIPDIALGTGSAPTAPLSMDMAEYYLELKNLGLLDNEISSFSAGQLFEAGVPISYLTELNEAELLDGLSFVYIQNYYAGQIPTEYLLQMKEEGFYEQLSFVEIINFYENEIPFEFLNQLDQKGYLEELSFVYITEYYEAGVPVEFLDELKEMGLYEDLSFLDVIRMYKSEQEN